MRDTALSGSTLFRVCLAANLEKKEASKKAAAEQKEAEKKAAAEQKESEKKLKKQQKEAETLLNTLLKAYRR